MTHNQTAEQTAKNIQGLTSSLEELFHLIDDAEQRGQETEAQSLERIAGRMEDLLQEQRDILQRIESEAPRRAAEARLAYHLENDTLDLY